MNATTKHARTWRRAVVAVLMALALVAGACGGADDDAASSAPSDRPAAEPAAEPSDAVADDVIAEELAADGDGAGEEEPAGSEGAGGDAGVSGVPAKLDPASLGRSIVYVADVEVIVDDVPLAASRAKTAIAGLGGLLFGEDTRTGENDRTMLEFKVLPEDFQDALARLEGLGDLQSQQISADDVTERVVDLRSRIATAEISVARLREFLTGATDLEAIASLEAQLVQRETDLETLRGQLRTIEDQVDLATIFLTLLESAPPEVIAEVEFEVTAYEGDDDGARCPGLDQLEVDEGAATTVCVQLTNTGNVSVEEIEVRDDRLGLRPRDFAIVDDVDRLAPGETATAWTVFEAPAEGVLLIRPSAIAVDADGEKLRVAVELRSVADYSLGFIEDDSLPGFTDSLAASWDFFGRLVGMVVLLAGAIVPFVWVPLMLWGIWMWWTRRRPSGSAVPTT